MSDNHVDREYLDPLSASPPRLQARYRSREDPRIGAQERDGWATYVSISDYHPDDNCPYGEGEVLEPESLVTTPESWRVAHTWPGKDVDGNTFQAPVICPICSALLPVGNYVNECGSTRLDYTCARQHVAWHQTLADGN